MNTDLRKISERAFQCNMNFYPDPTKQAHELFFSGKSQKMIFLPIFFSKTPVVQAPRIFSDIRLECWTSVSILRPLFTKKNKTIGLLQKFHYVLPRPSFLTIYNSFVLTHLNYGDIIYDQALFKISRQNEIESIQYNTTLIGAIIGD